MVTTVATPPAPTTRSLSRRLTELDGIRGVAATLVLLSHTTFVGLPGGFVGVDIFFVLSGFIITGLLLDETRATGAVRLSRFWARRATRLLPPALFVVVVVVVVSMAVDNYTTRQQTFGDAVAAALYVENWHLIAQGSDYFGESLSPSRLRNYWSLAVEEQFYVVWPLLLLAFARRSRWAKPTAIRIGRILIPITVLVAASYLFAVRADDGTGLVAYMGTFARAWQLLLGAAIAVGWRWSSRWLPPMRADITALVGAGVLALLCVIATPANYLPYGGLLLGVAAATLILGLVEPGPYSRRAFNARWLQYLGKISYSVYLWHWPVIVYSAKLLGDHVAAIPLTVLEIALTMGLAALTVRFVEGPLRHIKLRETRPLLVVLVAVAVSIGLALGFTALGRADTARLVSATGVDLAAAEKDRSVIACPDQPTPCVRHVGKSGLVVATVGDSTMQHYDPTLRALAKQYDFTYVQGAVGGCPIGHKFLATGTESLHKASNYNCMKWFPGAYRELLSKYRPDVILMTSSNEKAQFVDASGKLLATGSAAHKAGTAAALRQSMNLLASGGATLINMDQLPRGKGVDCLAEKASPAACTTTVASDPSTAAYAALSRDVTRSVPRARSISLTDVVCPDGTCPAIIDDRVVRYDGGHFTGGFARSLAPYLVERLSKVGVDLTARRATSS